LQWARLGAVAALLAMGPAACDESGIDPPTDRLYNPVALAADPEGRFLLVANGDFGLKYTSASVVAVDLRRVGEALGTWPRDAAGAPEGERVTAIPVEVGGALLAEQTVRIGPFAARMRVHPERDVAYVSVRGDSTVYVLELETSEDRLERIDCGGRAEPLQTCSSDHRLLATAEGNSTHLREPSGLALLRRPPEADGALAKWALLTSYLRSGDLALFPLDDAGLPRAGAAQGAHLDLQVPSRDLVAHPDGRQIYVSTREGSDLRSVTLDVEQGADDELWELRDRGSVTTGTAAGVAASETRGVAVSGSGERIFVARRHVTTQTGTAPADLVVLQRTLSEFGGVRLDVVGTLRLDERPIAMAYVASEALHPAGVGVPDPARPAWPGGAPDWRGPGGPKADAGAQDDAGPDVEEPDLGSEEADLEPASDAGDGADAGVPPDPLDAGPQADAASPTPDGGWVDGGSGVSDAGPEGPDAGEDAPDPEPPRWSDLLFVVCYEGGRVLVLDAEHLVLLGSVEVGKAPYDIAVAPLGGGRRAAHGPGQGYAYISHFRGDRISVVDIDPSSPTWLRKVATIR